MSIICQSNSVKIYMGMLQTQPFNNSKKIYIYKRIKKEDYSKKYGNK